jgi:hypothetical protein
MKLWINPQQIRKGGWNMGQRFYVVNERKEQYIDPNCFGDGAQLLQFGCSGEGTMMALALLLRQSNGGGGDDYHGSHEIVGTWANDPIVIVGDYDQTQLYQKAYKKFLNVSHYAVAAMQDDRYTAEQLAGRGVGTEFAKFCPHDPRHGESVVAAVPDAMADAMADLDAWIDDHEKS